MTAFVGIAAALVKGFLRDRTAVFFALVFPLMFLVLFGALFSTSSSPRLDLVQVGPVAVLDQMPAPARKAFEDSFAVRTGEDLGTALAEVRSGDADVAVTMDGSTLVAHYTRTDQVRAAMVRGTLAAFVDAANQAVSGAPPAFGFRAEAVEDDSLKAIQYLTPGLLGWAVAMSATFGAAATVQGWRQTKLLRRLQLSPAPAVAVVAARIVVTLAVALVQLAAFVGVGKLGFGLQLTGAWWAGIPLLLLGTLSFMSLGLMAGALAQSQEGAVNMANFMVMPMAFLSGSFFSLEGAPGWLQSVSWLMPLRHLNEGMLDVLVRGESPTAVLAPAVYILGFGVLVGALAAVRFRRVGL